MKRFRLFVENFFVYGLGTMVSKLVPLIMLPIITRLMPNSFYLGLNDLSVTISSFASAIAIMGFYDALYRLFFEKNEEQYKKEVCSTAFIFTIITSIIVFLILIIFRDFFSKFFFEDVKYANLLFLTALSVLIGATNSIIAAPTRMQNKKKTFIFFNTIGPIISYSISIPLLLTGHYIIALPLASVISALFIELSFFTINKKWFSLKNFRFKYLMDLLKIGVPLMPNFLVYWIFNSSDKLMISKMIGVHFTGIYTVGGKIGQVSQLIYTAFSGGWQYFSFSTMKDKDQVQLVSNIFEYLGIISFIAGMLLCCFNKYIFAILFPSEYQSASTIAPYLFMAPLLQMLYQIACNQFVIIKKTWPTLIILSSGAILNVFINYYGIKYIGIEGAAIGTLVGYSISTIICVVTLTHMKLIRVKRRFIIAVAFFLLFFFLYRLVINNFIFTMFSTLVVTIIYFMLYKRDIAKLFLKK